MVLLRASFFLICYLIKILSCIFTNSIHSISYRAFSHASLLRVYLTLSIYIIIRMHNCRTVIIAVWRKIVVGQHFYSGRQSYSSKPSRSEVTWCDISWKADWNDSNFLARYLRKWFGSRSFLVLTWFSFVIDTLWNANEMPMKRYEKPMKC